MTHFDGISLLRCVVLIVGIVEVYIAWTIDTAEDPE